jgi:hypothetical protein
MPGVDYAIKHGIPATCIAYEYIIALQRHRIRMKSISDSPSMALSHSASVHSHRVNVRLSPVEPLPMASHHLFTIFILEEIIEMEVRERTIVDKIKKW